MNSKLLKRHPIPELTYQEVAKLFSWKFTADDLKKRLQAIQEFNALAAFTPKTGEIEV